MTQVITAIVVNYNAGPLLRRCAEALLACPLVAKVVVVDNASSDGSLSALAGLPRLLTIENADNRGFAAACNQGIDRVDTEYLLFMNPDCTFAPGALQPIIDTLRADTSVGMAGGMLVNPDGTEQVGGRRAIPTPWRSFVRAFGLYRLNGWWPTIFFDFNLHKQPLPDVPIEVEAISGACMLVKRAAVDSVGRWDERYFLHCEDLDWCMRFRQQGWKIMFVPNAKIEHDAGTCSRRRPIFVEWHKHKGMVRFYRKFFMHQYPGVLMWLVGAGVWLRFAAVACRHAARGLWRRLRVRRSF
ncbi:MAG: glycosyltransferase family 2 protein [Methylomicrobium sp.]